jgi:DNA modification methylase
LLAVEFAELEGLDLDLELTLTGFDTAEIDRLTGAVKVGDTAADQVRAPPAAPVSARGDLWRLGEHRLLCGDALEPAAWSALMQGDRAALVISDLPYNLKIDGHVSGLGAVRHAEFAMASGEMSGAEFTGFLRQVCERLVANSIDGSIHYLFMDWRHLAELLAATGPTYSELKNLCVWVKPNAGMGSFYRSRHELVFVLKNGRAPHVNNFGLGDKGRHRSNVWEYQGANGFFAGRAETLQGHPTIKPVDLVKDAILDCSHRGSIVLDPFVGSGTTLIAAEKTRRR